MGLTYQKRRLRVNKAKRAIAQNRANLQRFRVFLAMIMTLLICWFGLWILKSPQWFIDSNKLNLQDPSVITLQGNIITPDYKIINMVRQTQLPNTQIFRLNTKELEENISQLQPIKKVYIRRCWWPARLTIMVDERVPAFLIAPNLETEPNSALTTDGVMIDHDYLPLRGNFKAKKLLTYGIKDGYDEIWDKKKVDEIIKVVKAVETYSGQEVRYIDLRDSKNIYVMIQDYLIRLGELNDTVLKRIEKIASILPKAKTVEEKIKYIDLGWDDAQYFRLEGSKEIVKPQGNTAKPKENQAKNETNQTTQTYEELLNSADETTNTEVKNDNQEHLEEMVD